MASGRSRTLTLPTALSAFVIASGLIFGVITVFLVFDQAKEFQTEGLAEAVEVRGRHAANDLAHSLEETWLRLGAIREDEVFSDPEVLRGALEVVVGNGTQVSWAGVAGPDGLVRLASDGLLVGADVSSRPWFQRGLTGDFAGDVHEAVLLNDLLGGTEEEPFRFIDLAAPILGPDGMVSGVIGFHINFAWAEANLSEIAGELELDLFLVNQAGEIIIATDPSVGTGAGLQAFRAAAAGVATTTVEVWPDGGSYVATVMPEVRHPDLPSFGWRMVARIAPNAFDEAQADLIRSVSTVLAATGFLLLVMTAAFSSWFLRPFGVLARNAERIADGADDYPFESRRTDELAVLSAALARLQSKGLQGEAPARGPMSEPEET